MYDITIIYAGTGERLCVLKQRFDEKELKKLTKVLKKAPEECRKGLSSAINRSVKTTNTPCRGPSPPDTTSRKGP